MTILIYWQLDTAAEPRRSEPTVRPALPALVRDARRPTQNRFDYYAQIAEAAAQTGFDGLFLPHRQEADDARITAAALAREAPRLQLVAQFPASIGSAVYAAKQAVTFQRATGNRLSWAIAPDANAVTRAAEGDFLTEGQLGERLDEFLTVARGVHGQRPFTFQGRHFKVSNGGFDDPLNRVAFPTVFLGGEREEDLDLSARLADVHLFGPHSVTHLSSLVEGLDALANRAGRHVAFGLLQPVLARENAAEAVRDAHRGETAPGTLVGSWDDVADQLAERVSLGISHLVLAGTPQLEEAYAQGQQLLPRLRAQLAVRARAA
jgi:alkanesulfonate monooxygenase